MRSVRALYTRSSAATVRKLAKIERQLLRIERTPDGFTQYVKAVTTVSFVGLVLTFFSGGGTGTVSRDDAASAVVRSDP